MALYDTYFFLIVRFTTHNLTLLNQRKVIVSGNIVLTPNCEDAVGKPKYRKRGKTQTRYREAFKTISGYMPDSRTEFPLKNYFKPLGVSDVV